MKKFNIFKYILIICMLMVPSLFTTEGAFAGTTYYVSPNGSDNSSGTISAPFKTIQKAAGIVVAGDTVIVKDGTYTTTGSDLVTINSSGTSSAWITFKAENKWGAVLDGRNSTTQGGIVLGNVASYVRIEDFEINGFVAYGITSGNGTNVNNIYISGNKIHDIGRTQLACDHPAATYGKVGIYTGIGTSNWTIRNNIIYNIGRLPGGCSAYDYNHDHGLYITNSNVTIIYNIFYNNKAGWHIQLSGNYAMIGINIINNTFYGKTPQKSGHILTGWQIHNLVVQNNISHTPGAYFIENEFGYAYQGRSSSIVLGTNGSTKYKAKVDHISTTNDKPTTGANWATYWKSTTLTDVSPSTWILGNQYYEKNIVRNNLVYGGAIAHYVTEALYTTFANNIVGQDPLFVNLITYDFNLKSGSPAIDAGVNAGLSVDIEGNPIVGFPDMGAYEYSGASVEPPISDTLPPSSPISLRTAAAPSSILSNSGFELGRSPWVFYTNGAGTFNIDASGNGSAQAGHVVITTAGTNVQIYQADVILEPNTLYQLSFKAYSNTGHDVRVALHKHASPYTSYGLSQAIDLTASWQEHSLQFTTSGFTATVNDSRLVFFLSSYNVRGDEYFFDDVILTTLGATN